MAFTYRLDPQTTLCRVRSPGPSDLRELHLVLQRIASDPGFGDRGVLIELPDLAGSRAAPDPGHFADRLRPLCHRFDGGIAFIPGSPIEEATAHGLALALVYIGIAARSFDSTEPALQWLSDPGTRTAD